MSGECEGTTFVKHKKDNDKTSIWSVFLTSKDGASAKCKDCNKVLKTGGGSTKGLHTHFFAIHGRKISTTEIPTSGSGSGSKVVDGKRPCSSEPDKNLGQIPGTKKKQKLEDYNFKSCKRDSLSETLARMTAKDGMPFYMFVKSADLRKLFEGMGHHDLPKSPNGIKNRVIKYYTEIRQLITAEIKQRKSSGARFSLTFDEWTSTANKRYMNVNLHAADEFWNLGLVRVRGTMTAEKCKELLEGHLIQFGLCLEKDIVCIVTDGPSVMVKEGKLVMAEHQLCMVHGIHLAVCDVFYKNKGQSTEVDILEKQVGDSDENELEEGEETEDEVHENEDLENAESCLNFASTETASERDLDVLSDYHDLNAIIKNVRKIVALFRRSPVKNDDILQKYVKEEQGKEMQLLLDVKNRWNSLVTTLERFVILKE